MDPHQQAKEEELRRREAELKTRELQIRMRELEAELDKTSVHPTYKHEEPPQKKKRTWYERIPNIAKFLMMVVLVIVAIRVASWLFTAALVLGLAFVGYKLFLEGDRN
ncbi:MAG: hypothetical protein AAFQ89_13190 [Cyanobacteria bacterium J06626_18]